MNYDYSKVVNFLYDKNVSKLNEVIKTIMNTGFTMTFVDTNSKIIFMNKNGVEYFLLKDKDRVLFLPHKFQTLSFSDDFGEIIEVNINEDGDIVTSNIFNLNGGVVAATSTWHFANNLYTQNMGRFLFLKKEKLDIINNRETIESFINTYYLKRNGVLKDLYWDMESLRKSNFIEPLLSMRIQINDGYKEEPFDVLYKNYIDNIINIINEKNKPGLF